MISKNSFDYYKRLLNSAIKQAKALYYMKKSIRCNGDVRATWKFINDMLGRKEGRCIKYVRGDGDANLTGVSMVNYFNKYFVNVISDLTTTNNMIPIKNCLKSVPINKIPFSFYPYLS